MKANKDDLVDEDVKVEDKKVGEVEDDNVNNEGDGDIMVVDFDDFGGVKK